MLSLNMFFHTCVHTEEQFTVAAERSFSTKVDTRMPAICIECNNCDFVSGRYKQPYIFRHVGSQCQNQNTRLHFLHRFCGQRF
jgi:hypothetical protein